MNKEFTLGMLAMFLIILFAICFIVVGHMIAEPGKVQIKEVIVKEYYPAPFDIKVDKYDTGEIMINGELK